MAFPFKSFFYRNAILCWFSASLAGLMLGGLPLVTQMAAASPSQGANAREANAQAVAQTVARATSGMQSNEESSQSSPWGKKDQAVLKANLEKLRRDAGELADLAKVFQEELNNSNENLLPLGVVEKAGKIEKLAKRIKGTARGF